MKNTIPVPGWNDYVKGLHSQARVKFKLWCDTGKPRGGPVVDDMRAARKEFKYALRSCKNNKAQLEADGLAKSLMHKDMRGFWKAIHTSTNSNISSANTVGGKVGSADILKMWHEHYSGAFQSVRNTDDEHPSLLNRLNDTVLHSTHLRCFNVELKHIISSLKSGKSARPDGLTSEYLLHEHESIVALLLALFHMICVHCYVPGVLTEVMIIPLVKNKNKDITDTNNYRPIAIANIVSKVLERIILMRIQHVVTICDNQFGFKKAQFTDLAIYTLKEVVQYYTVRGSPVFACFLDATKAFDRVNHCLLFNKLLDTGWPPSIVKALYIWYGTQRFRVKWANDGSNRIAVSCGVRQGSILSPTLFNIYMNDLQLELNGCRVGCHIGNLSFNNIAYADDMVLPSPSAKGLNCLLGVCESYAKKHDVVYNTTKSKVMLFPCKTFNVNPKLDEDQMEQIHEYVYLGHVITPNFNDNLDIARKKRAICIRANTLSRNFFKCTPNIKALLFKLYCSNVYCAHLWANYAHYHLAKLRVCYNHAFRKLFHFDRYCSASMMFVNLLTPSLNFGEIMRSNIYNFICRLWRCQNKVISTLLCCDSVLISPLWVHWNSALFVPRR